MRGWISHLVVPPERSSGPFPRRARGAFGHGLLALILITGLGCGGPEPSPREPSERGSTSGQSQGGQAPPPGPADEGGRVERPTLTAQECEASGGEVVGDIGDGAIHRPGYRCPGGAEPLGEVPLGVEGSVCCPP